MADWQFVAATAKGLPLAELTAARDRKVTWRRRGPAEAAWSIDGRHEQAAAVEELISDLLVYRDGRLLFRGRVGATDDSLDADSHEVSMVANDYRALLGRRLLFQPILFSVVDVGDIGWYLVGATQSLPGGYVGITRGLGANLGVTSAYNFEAGKYVGEALDDLAEVVDFDWEVDAALKFNLWQPARGFVRDFVAEYGSTVTTVNRAVDPGQYANVVRATGDQTKNEATPPVPWTTPHVSTMADLADRPEGRFDMQHGDPDVKVQSALVDRADRLLDRSAYVMPTYTCTLRPGVWDPDVLWLGDVCRIVIRSGRLDVNTVERIDQVDVTISDDGAETVALTFGTSRRLRLVDYLRSYSPRIDRLERR